MQKTTEEAKQESAAAVEHHHPGKQRLPGGHAQSTQLPAKRHGHNEIGDANQGKIPARQNSLLETAFQAQSHIDSSATD